MDVIESIKSDRIYLKCKAVVKSWEKNFRATYSRTPSKFDIKDAPKEVRYAYKKYFQLKSTALDNSLSILDLDEDVPCSPDPVHRLSQDAPSPESEKILECLPTGQQLEALLANAPSFSSVDSVKVKDTGKPTATFTNNVSKKILAGRRFSIRNPRKFSFNKSQSQLNDATSSVNAVDDTCGMSFSLPIDRYKHSQSSLSLSSKSFLELPINSINNTRTSVREIDIGWLDRITGFQTVSSEKNDLSYKCDAASACVARTGYNDSKANNVPELINEFIIENSESEPEDYELSKLKPALKKRKLCSNTSLKINKHNQTLSVNDLAEIDKSSSSANNVTKSQFLKSCDPYNDQPPDISEYVVFGVDENIAPRHSDISKIFREPLKNDVLNSTDSKTNKLDLKIKNGSLNDNYVKINIEKKKYVRGKKHINFSKYKKKQYKDKKALHQSMEFPDGGILTCYKCGNSGHMARYCKALKGDSLLPVADDDSDENPTLQDMASQSYLEPTNIEETLTTFKPSQIPETFMKMLAENPIAKSQSDVEPVYNHFTPKITEEIYETLRMFGHDSFRPGQEEVVKRILNGKSSLLIMSTGSGKSLCYQIPAYIYNKHQKCITLVISPLVSLMEDQVLSMPEFLKAGCLHTNQTPTQRQKIIQCLTNGDLNILLISPEALIVGDSSKGFGGLFKHLPPIAFACIDEAHCVSHWSHNFRPSYLMICRVLREKLKVKCILGLTATASKCTISSIIDHINVPDGEAGVITNPALPDNLCLSVSVAENKDAALFKLLTSEPICTFTSIIVYCIRRDECERVAALLRSALQEPGVRDIETHTKKRKRMSYNAEAYHAGLSAAQRKKVQKHFMDGTLRIIVATVAFGMGINKSDIRCIIHYNMPSSFESYVQEVGRAGRDGKPAKCHVLLGNSRNDKNELLKHIYSNSIERSTIRKIISKVFVPCDCREKFKPDQPVTSSNICTGHEICIPIDKTVEELDLASENISTLLCYLELHKKKYIKNLNNSYTFCKITSYGGEEEIIKMANNCLPLKVAIMMQKKKQCLNKNILEFPVIDVSATIGWDSNIVKFHLKNLEWISEGGRSKRSLLKIEFHTLGFRLKAPGDLTATELDHILDDLHNTVLNQENSKLRQLEEISQAFHQLSNCNQSFTEMKSNKLKQIVQNYFERGEVCDKLIKIEPRPFNTEQISADVRALLSSYKDCDFTGRSVARIFQGIPSPNFPAVIWGRCKFWRSHIHEDFYEIVKIATQQIIQSIC